MPYLTIYSAAPGTPLKDGTRSIVGHVWAETQLPSGDIMGNGFYPSARGSLAAGVTNRHGVPDGEIYGRSGPTVWSRTVWISDAAQAVFVRATIASEANNSASFSQRIFEYEGLNGVTIRESSQYSLFGNSCVDRVYDLTRSMGMHASKFEGILDPVGNRPYLNGMLDFFATGRSHLWNPAIAGSINSSLASNGELSIFGVGQIRSENNLNVNGLGSMTRRYADDSYSLQTNAPGVITEQFFNASGRLLSERIYKYDYAGSVSSALTINGLDESTFTEVLTLNPVRVGSLRLSANGEPPNLIRYQDMGASAAFDNLLLAQAAEMVASMGVQLVNKIKAKFDRGTTIERTDGIAEIAVDSDFVEAGADSFGSETRAESPTYENSVVDTLWQQLTVPVANSQLPRLESENMHWSQLESRLGVNESDNLTVANQWLISASSQSLDSSEDIEISIDSNLVQSNFISTVTLDTVTKAKKFESQAMF
jgi:hypothetical protein